MSRYKLILLSTLSTLLFPLFLSAQLEIPETVRYLALGDSYTIGESVPADKRWPLQLADSLEVRGYLVESTDIIATTGWTTTNLLNAISGEELADEDYNLVSLLIGVNNQYQGQNIDFYDPQFRQLLDSCIAYAGGDTSGVFVVSIPDYAYTPFGQGSNPDQISAELDEYNSINQSITEEYGITYFNITPISREGIERPELVAGDNLHPSGLQYTEWVELMLQYVDEQATAATEASVSRLRMYPIPTQDVIVIESAELPDGTQLIISDTIGREFLRVIAEPVGQTRISVANLPPGQYQLTARLGNQVVGQGTFLVQ